MKTQPCHQKTAVPIQANPYIEDLCAVQVESKGHDQNLKRSRSLPEQCGTRTGPHGIMLLNLMNLSSHSSLYSLLHQLAQLPMFHAIQLQGLYALRNALKDCSSISCSKTAHTSKAERQFSVKLLLCGSPEILKRYLHHVTVLLKQLSGIQLQYNLQINH